MPHLTSRSPSFWTRPGVLAISACLLLACSSHYMPRSNGKIAVVLKDGAPAYARDGRVYKHGMFGGGLLEVVQGHPAAEAAARTYRRRVGWGLGAALVGLACSTFALALAAPRDGEEELSPTPLLVAGGCFVGSMVGLGIGISGTPYQSDAINLFNDSVPEREQEPLTPQRMPGNFSPPGVTVNTGSGLRDKSGEQPVQ